MGLPCIHFVSAFLATLALALGQAGPPTHIAAGSARNAPVAYRVTVWVIRPLARQMPNPAQIGKKAGQPWMALADPQEAGVFKSDAALLAWMQRNNRMFEIDRFRQKVTATVPADTWWTAPLPASTKFALRIHHADRETVLNNMLSGMRSSPAYARQFRRSTAGQLVLESRSQTPQPTAKVYGYQNGGRPAGPAGGSTEVAVVGSGGGGTSNTVGFRTVRSNAVFIVDNTTGYVTAYQAVIGPRPGAKRPVTVQNPMDILLVRIEQIR